MPKGCTTIAYDTKNNANPKTSMITTLLAIKKASVRATHERRINVRCLDRKMRSGQHGAYPEETLETGELATRSHRRYSSGNKLRHATSVKGKYRGFLC